MLGKFCWCMLALLFAAGCRGTTTRIDGPPETPAKSQPQRAEENVKDQATMPVVRPPDKLPEESLPFTGDAEESTPNRCEDKPQTTPAGEGVATATPVAPPEPVPPPPDTPVVPPPPEIKAVGLPRFYAGGKELSGQECYVLHCQDWIKISVPPRCYFYLFERSRAGIAPLEVYWKKPADLSRDLTIFVNNLQTDTEWLLFTSTDPVSKEEILQARAPSSTPVYEDKRGLKPRVREEVPGDASRFSIRAACLDEMNGPEQKIDVEISRIPFSVHLSVRRYGAGNFAPFDPAADAICEDDQLQIHVELHADTYLAMFLCDSHKNISQIFPQEGEYASKLGPDIDSFALPSPGDGFVFDAAEGTEYLLCFYDGKQFRCEAIQRWLKMADLEKQAAVAKRGSQVMTLPAPAPVYIVPFAHRARR